VTPCIEARGFDLVIRNARIVDGANSPWYRGDVGVRDGTIVFVGTLPADAAAASEIDAADRALAPGFIDMHTHNDFLLLKEPASVPKLKQGVTTVMVGQCGISAAPVRPEKAPLLESYTGFIMAGASPGWHWRSFGEYLDVLGGLELGVNVGSFVGHGTIRLNVLGFEDRTPSRDELAAMRDHARRAMEEGAFGMTSGLVYAPGVYSAPEEVEEIAKGLVERRGLYLSHMRSESDDVVASVRETIAVAEKLGIPGQVLHHKACGRRNRGKVKETMRLLEEARERGVDMTADQYPYAAGSTTLRSILSPWVHEGGVDRLIERLADSALRERLKREIPEAEGWENMLRNSGGPEGVMMLYCPKTPDFEGKRLTEIGAMTGSDPLDAAFDIIIANRGSDTACFFQLAEEDVQFVMKHPLVMVASDSIPPALGAKCHPRTNGTFPRVLGRYVREQKILRLEEAVWKMSGFPAARLGLAKKGLVREGMDADLVLFDPETVIDGATFEDPFGSPKGISHVFVSGRLAVHNGEYTGAAAGKVLRKA